jgi:hypothetical protein
LYLNTHIYTNIHTYIHTHTHKHTHTLPSSAEANKRAALLHSTPLLCPLDRSQCNFTLNFTDIKKTEIRATSNAINCEYVYLRKVTIYNIVIYYTIYVT